MRIHEATNDTLPKKFWLILDIPYSKEPRDHDLQRLNDLASRQLHGVRGISGSRVIMTEMFLIARNAAIVMNPEAVAASNNLEKIHYDDPHYLLKNNMKAMYRIWSKEGVGGKRNDHGAIQNLMDYAARHMDANAQYAASSISLGWKVAGEFSKSPVHVETLDDITNAIFDIILNLSEKGDSNSWYIKRVLEHLNKEQLKESLFHALKHQGKIYKSEDEWIINDPTFTIPEGSTMLVGINPDVIPKYEKWKSGDIDFEMSVNSYAFNNHHYLMKAISDYHLDEIYNIQYIDAKKFQTIRSDVSSRRWNKLSEDVLPMDKASRMQRAKEMGFNTVAYHGTANKFNEFDMDKGKAGVFGFAPFFSNTKKEASGYAKTRSEENGGKGKTLSVMLRINKPVVISGYYEKISPELYEIIAGNTFNNSSYRVQDLTFKDAVNQVGGEYYDKHNTYDHKVIWKGIYNRLKKAGYDAIIYKDTPPDHSDFKYDKIVMLDMSAIRLSSAAFDPSRINDTNLNA